MASEREIILGRLASLMRKQGATRLDVSELAGIPAKKLELWGVPEVAPPPAWEPPGGMKIMGDDKGRILAFLDGEAGAKPKAPEGNGHASPPNPADAFLVVEETIRHRRFKLDHAALCSLLGLDPQATELELLECDKRKIALPLTVEADTTERTYREERLDTPEVRG